MGDDVIQRLFEKIDDLRERMARVETILVEKEKANKNYTGIVAWIVTILIALYGAMKGGLHG